MADPGSVDVPHRALAFVLATVGINMLGVGLAWPILPKLVLELGGGGISDAAFAYAWIAALYAIAQFLLAPLLGALSDARGRRPVLLVSQAALAVDYFLMVVVPDLWWLALLRFLSGAFAATVSTANAYIADISTPETRARNFGFVGASFGIGFILGPVLGGLLGEVSLRLPFLVAGLLTSANVAFGLLALPESLPADRRRPVGWSAANPLRAIAAVGRLPLVAGLLGAHALSSLAQRGLEATWILYTAYRFGWGVREGALSLAFVGLVYFVVQAGLVGPIVARFGERRTLLVGLALGFASMALYPFASLGWQAYPIIALYCIGNAVAQPALLSLASSRVEQDAQGELQGTMSSLNAASVVVAPLVASLLLSVTTGDNLPPVAAGAWYAAAAVLYLLALRGVVRSSNPVGTSDVAGASDALRSSGR